jgi:anaerobic C4-dicarboxylate transporter
MVRYFLILVAAFNLFFAVGYPAYSGIALFGDWAGVISGLDPPWIWRFVLVAVAVAGYYASMRLLIDPMAPFAGVAEDEAESVLAQARIRRITLIPYIGSMAVACAAAALNPRGPMQILTSGLPAAAAAFGLTQMDNLIIPRHTRTVGGLLKPLQRSVPWIVAAVIVLTCFVLVLGRGLQFS